MKVDNFSTHTFSGIPNLTNALSVFYNPNAILPTLAIESGVTIGRTAVASKRGGKMEATERFIEQGTSAVIWIWGVQFLKKIGDTIGNKLLKLNLNFDVGYDHLRNPLKNNNIGVALRNFKIANMFLSTAIATYFIGFVLPKINHKISKKYDVKDNRREKNTLENTQFISMEKFLNNIKKNKNLSFGSTYDMLAHTLENNQTARLLITDTGVIAGRCHNARNKYEKIENLFRDISSVYFYLFATNHFVRIMNKLVKNTNINPKTLACLKEELLKHTNEDVSTFKKSALSEISKENADKLKELFNNNQKIVNVDDFIKVFPNFTQKAKEMAKLQPIFNGNGVLSYSQARDVLCQGWITNPEFLQNVMKKATDGASADKMRFVKAKKLENIRKSISDFVTQVEQYALKQNSNIDEKLIERVVNNNMKKNLKFYIMGTAISIISLSYIIPKIQYFITEKLTNKKNFPGAENYKA